MSTPIPRPAPVTSQTFLSVSDIDVLLYGWALHARQHLLSRSQPFANALARSWWRPVTYGPPAMNGGRHARSLAAAPPLFTRVRGIRILRTSPFGHSRKFAFKEFYELRPNGVLRSSA